MLKFNCNLSDRQWSVAGKFYDLLKTMKENDMAIIIDPQIMIMYLVNKKDVEYVKSLCDAGSNIVLVGGVHMDSITETGVNDVAVVDISNTVMFANSDEMFFIIEKRKEQNNK